MLAVAASGVGAYVLDSMRTPEYSGYTRVLVRPSSKVSDSRTLVDLIGQIGFRYITGTFAQTFTSEKVKSAARQTAGLSVAEAARYPLQANVLPDTVVIEVNGKGPDPNVLAKYLNATVDATVQQTRTVFGVVELEPLEEALVPPTPTSPQLVRDVSLGLALGFLLGFLLAWTFAFLREMRMLRQGVGAERAYWATQAE